MLGSIPRDGHPPDTASNPFPVHFPANLQPRPTTLSLPASPPPLPPLCARHIELLRPPVRSTEFEGIDRPPADTQKHRRKKAGRHAKVISHSLSLSLSGRIYVTRQDESSFIIVRRHDIELSFYFLSRCRRHLLTPRWEFRENNFCTVRLFFCRITRRGCRWGIDVPFFVLWQKRIDGLWYIPTVIQKLYHFFKYYDTVVTTSDQYFHFTNILELIILNGVNN